RARVPGECRTRRCTRNRHGLVDPPRCRSTALRAMARQRHGSTPRPLRGGGGNDRRREGERQVACGTHPERPPCDTRCMFNVPVLDSSDVETFYESLAHQLEALLGDETDLIANLANTAALLWHTVPQINWAGFYLLRDDELVLGPFQGKPAC